ncbi:DNA-directed RNA polymerase V subunit 1 isoform X1 [Triticum aestivum]|nr:DNA-directed RNA polymerase V subunit 1-like isoform X1 [Triticum aestivum]
MEAGDDPTFVAEGTVTSISLAVASNQEIVKAQPMKEEFPVTHPSQLAGNPALGLPLQLGHCDSCGATDLAKCEGHFGFIKLPVSVYHPSHIAELTKILNMICFSCLQFKNCKKQKSVEKESNFTSCSYCQDLPPIHVAKVKKSNGALTLELRVPSRKELEEGFWSFLDQFGFHTKGSSHCHRLFAEEVQKIMEKISEKTRRQIAAKGYILQDGFVMSNLPVPPNCLRAYNVLDETLMCSPDASTNLLRKIVLNVHRINNSRVGPPTFKEHEVEADDLQVAIADYIKHAGTARGPQDITFKSLPATKQWQQKMKSLCISKSSSFSCRGVITGDPYIPMNVVGVPGEVARRMSVQERVTDYNIAQLQGMMDRGLCLTHEDANSIMHSLDVGKANKKRTILKVGETVNRRILDGDAVFVNRPPSTDKHSVQAMYVRVHTDHTIKINPLICGPLGADFDGDCVHIFFPRSVSARAEAIELFTVEKQLVSSHNAKLNFQLKNDCLLALKKMSARKYSRREANELLNAMFTAGLIPKKRLSGRPEWSFAQILETVLPQENKILIRDLVAGTITISSVLSTKNPREAIEFLNLLQPLLMESLFTDGFSVSLRDFNVQNPIPQTIQHQTLDLDKLRKPIVDFITSSDIRFLVDQKRDSAMTKVVEQIGFLGHQLQRNGRLYSGSLVEDCVSKSLSKCGSSTNGCHPLEAHGFVRNSLCNGLNPYEDLLHSISAREKTIRASKGLVEPGVLFKNMMAMLRDVVACYDGTIRNSCGNSVVKFDSRNSSSSVTPGDPVGILAATAVTNAAYKAVLDPNQNNMASWDSMKEVLLTRASSRNENDQKIILYLNKCSCGDNFCMERASLAVQACLKRTKVEDCATEFSIHYQQQNIQATHCLVGHIHLDKKQLDEMNISMQGILQKCQKEIYRCGKKKGQVNQLMKRVVISSEYMCYQDADDEEQVSCLQFFLTKSVTTQSESSARVVQLMANTISPILLDTIIKGDPRVQEVNIIWAEPQDTCWVQNSGTEQKGELALVITMDKDSTGESGDVWGTAMDACIPVMDLIDTTRSVPYSIQRVREGFGISSAFGRVTQHLSKAVGMVTKSVLEEHLTTVASSITCTGNLHGFNSYGYKATFKALKIQAPFMKATRARPLQCFEEGAEKVYSDQLDSVVSTCSWGNPAPIGTGSAFKIHWNDGNTSASNENLGGYGLYEFLTEVETTRATEDNMIVPYGSCLYDVDNLQEDEIEEDEVLCLGGNSPISWTDRPKSNLLLHDLQGWRAEQGHQKVPVANWQHGKHVTTKSSGTSGWNQSSSTTKVYQRRQRNSNWGSDATQQDGNPCWNKAYVAGPSNFAITGPSSGTSGWNQSSSTTKVYQRRQLDSNWSSDATQQDGNASWKKANVAGQGNFAITGPSSSGGWSRKTNNLGRGRRGGRGAIWKSEGSHRGGNSRWKAQRANTTSAPNFHNSGPSNYGGRNIKTGRGPAWRSNGPNRGGSNSEQRGSSNFTLAEQQIHAQVDPIMKEVKRIIRESRDGIKLSGDDERFIVENILMYHPEKEKKMAGNNNYIMVAKHQKFHSSRCLYVASSDGPPTDFSYKKCLENMIRIHYPHEASSFCRKYFQ